MTGQHIFRPNHPNWKSDSLKELYGFFRQIGIESQEIINQNIRVSHVQRVVPQTF